MSTEPTTSDVEEANKQVVADYMAAFSAGDVEKAMSFLAESATWWIAGSIPGISGTMDKRGFTETASQVMASTRTGAVRLTPLAWTAQGDRVAVEAESYGELKNGRVYNNLFHFLFDVRDGRIQSTKEYLDTEHVRETFAP